MTSIDQTKIRRARTGLIAHDPARALPGYTLFAPMFGDGTVYLIDMNGRGRAHLDAAHRPGALRVPARQRAPLLQRQGRGRREALRGVGAVSRGARPSRSTGTARSCGRSATRTITTMRASCATATSSCCACARCRRRSRARVRGGLPGTESDGTMYADYLVEMTTGGEVVWEWRSWEHLDSGDRRHHRAGPPRGVDARQHRRRDCPMATWWSASATSRPSSSSTARPGAIVWKLGGPPLAQQHDPRPLPNGNLLIFDNGPHRRDHPAPYSRVIEVDPRTSEIVWEYHDQSLFEFFSPYISGAQRLPNGNTLICEGCYGRHLRGDARGRGRVGIRQPALLRRAGPPRAQQLGVPRVPLQRGGDRNGKTRLGRRAADHARKAGPACLRSIRRDGVVRSARSGRQRDTVRPARYGRDHRARAIRRQLWSRNNGSRS